MNRKSMISPRKLSIAVVLVACGGLIVPIIAERHSQQRLDAQNKDAESYYLEGEIGGLRVRIPRPCVEAVEWDIREDAIRSTRAASANAPAHPSIKSMRLTFKRPTGQCQDSDNLIRDYRGSFLNPSSDWVDVTINSGSNYPSSGIKANTLRAHFLVQGGSTAQEQLKADRSVNTEAVSGLRLTRIENHGGASLAKPTHLYIEQSTPDLVRTLIECTSTETQRTIPMCQMWINMEPSAKIYMGATFPMKRIHEWQEIQSSAMTKMMSFSN